jgi:hypothetical protein
MKKLIVFIVFLFSLNFFSQTYSLQLQYDVKCINYTIDEGSSSKETPHFFLTGFDKSTKKIMFMSSIVAFLTHRGMIDAWLWEENTPYKVPSVVKEDWFYMGGSLVTLVGVFITSHEYKDSFENYIKTALSGLLIGSECWDLVFGQFLYHDPLHPFPNWYGGFGFKNKTQRLAFDAGRVIIGILLLVFQE